MALQNTNLSLLRVLKSTSVNVHIMFILGHYNTQCTVYKATQDILYPVLLALDFCMEQMKTQSLEQMQLWQNEEQNPNGMRTTLDL